MTPFVILLVLASTFMHAGWNLLSTYERSTEVFYKRMLIAVIAIGFVPAVVSEATDALDHTGGMAVPGRLGNCGGGYTSSGWRGATR